MTFDEARRALGTIFLLALLDEASGGVISRGLADAGFRCGRLGCPICGPDAPPPAPAGQVKPDPEPVAPQAPRSAAGA